jgi:hypothetical protein
MCRLRLHRSALVSFIRIAFHMASEKADSRSLAFMYFVTASDHCE